MSDCAANVRIERYRRPPTIYGPPGEEMMRQLRGAVARRYRSWPRCRLHQCEMETRLFPDGTDFYWGELVCPKEGEVTEEALQDAIARQRLRDASRLPEGGE